MLFFIFKLQIPGNKIVRSQKWHFWNFFSEMISGKPKGISGFQIWGKWIMGFKKNPEWPQKHFFLNFNP